MYLLFHFYSTSYILQDVAMTIGKKGKGNKRHPDKKGTKYYPITTVHDTLLGVMNTTNSILLSKHSYFNSYKSTLFPYSVFPSLYLIRPCQMYLKLNTLSELNDGGKLAQNWGTVNFLSSSWFQKRQRNQRSNCQHLLDHRKSKRVPEKHLFLLY